MRKCWLLLLGLSVLGAAVGCSGSADRNKNKDKDRPTSTDKK